MREQKKRFGPLIFLLMPVIMAILVLTFLVIAGILALLMHFGAFTLDIHAGDLLPHAIIILIFLLVSLVIGLVIAMLVTILPMKGLNTLIDGLHRLADGDFSVRMRGKRFPIARDVVGSFNMLAEELSNAEMLRSDFVNNFSHEIKTPVVSIRGFARLLQKQPLTPQQKEYVDVIEQESTRVADMTQKILDLTKVENQSILTDLTSYNLSEQLRRCCLLVIDRAEKKGLELDADFPEVTVTASPTLLQQVWVNLLDNAVKFSLPDGTICISIQSMPNEVSVTIRNPSAPLSEDASKRIFQKFYQAESSHSGEGTGIGLSIVKRIVELHGGSAVAMWDNGFFSIRVTLPNF